jgi:hypothetical protein
MLARACEVCEMQGEIDSLRRDLDAMNAARAWQALRDFLNGTPEQWQARVDATPRISVNCGSQVSIGGVVMIDVLTDKESRP